MQTDMQVNGEQYDDEIVFDWAEIAGDYLRCLKRYWLQFLLLLILVVALTVAYSNWNYEPGYTAKITYAVNKTGDTGVDAAIAKRLSGAVTTITSTTEFTDELLMDIEKESVNKSYLINSTNTEGATLFTISVTSNNYNNANIVLDSLENIYPSWASKSNGTVELQVVDKSKAPISPENPYSLARSVINGIVLGGIFCFFLGTLYVITIKTVRKESDMKKITKKNCITSIPEVKIKKRTKSVKEQLLISNKRIDWGFKQSLLAAQLRIEKQMNQADRKVLLVSSTLPQEGKTTAAVNLALAFMKHNKKVLIMDGDIRNPSVGKLLGFEEEIKGLTDYFKKDAKLEEIVAMKDGLAVMNAGTQKGEVSGIISDSRMQELMSSLREHYDYIVIDTPPAHLFTDAALLSRYADAVLHIVRYDWSTTKEIKDGMSAFIQNRKLLGYIINRNPSGFSSYGKYGYSKYGHYGKYKRYIDLDESSLNTEDSL